MASALNEAESLINQLFDNKVIELSGNERAHLWLLKTHVLETRCMLEGLFNIQLIPKHLNPYPKGALD
jgi:hypothetical protein